MHVFVLDGTMSSLHPGFETNAGLTFKLLREISRTANLTVHYEAGIQWQDWSHAVDVAAGRGINRQIRRAYGTLASRYRPGDEIILIGFSRGAYAARSLAGIIDMVGLLTTHHATERNVNQAYRHYRNGGRGRAAEAFRLHHCYSHVEIAALGAWDTVRSLGIALPGGTRWVEVANNLHNLTLSSTVRHGFHALALDETRDSFRPLIWHTTHDRSGHVEQMWFRGTHGDIGGQLNGFAPARPLANIPLVWMLERLETCGLILPEGWHARFDQDPTAPSVGTWRGWGKVFLSRHPRVVGRDPSERLHVTAKGLGTAVAAPGFDAVEA